MVFPFVKLIKTQLGVPPVFQEPQTNILPLEVVRDLMENVDFKFLAAVGIPANTLIPTLSFQEFHEFMEGGPVVWKRFLDMFVNKYKKLAAQDSDKRSINNIFHNRLVKHGNNATKSILIYPGQWQMHSAISFAQNILTHSRLSIYTLNITHPLTNPDNAEEMNPLLTGSLSACHTSERYLSAAVCLSRRAGGRWGHPFWIRS